MIALGISGCLTNSLTADTVELSNLSITLASIQERTKIAATYTLDSVGAEEVISGIWELSSLSCVNQVSVKHITSGLYRAAYCLRSASFS